MAVKKGILDNFLKPSSHYSDNQKNLRSIFIDKNEDDFKPAPKDFLEVSLLEEKPFGTQLEHERGTIGTQPIPEEIIASPKYTKQQIPIVTDKEHNRNTIGTQQEHIKNESTIQKEQPPVVNRNTKGTQLEHVKEHAIEHNKGTIRTQQEHNPVHKNTTRTQQEHVKEHNIAHNKNTFGTPLEHNKDTLYGLSYLTGIQKQLIVFFYQSCKKTRSHITEEFSLSNIADALKIRLGSIKTSLRRLEEKNFITGVQFKKGRGGWTKFELSDSTYRDLLENEKEHNWNTIGAQKGHISDTYRNTEKDTNTSSSSSNLIKTTTTELSEEWKFDITAYQRFGFTMTQVKQLASLGIISSIDVEQSLIEFSYDLDNNALPPIKTNKINFLMGLLRSGNSYVSEGYKNEQDAMIAEMARRSEEKRKKQLEDKFIAWESSLSDEERIHIEKKFPPQLMVLHRTYGVSHADVKNWLFNYFLQNQ